MNTGFLKSKMACFLLNKSNTKVAIPKFEEADKVTFYVILIRVGQFSWTVEHRYSDFVVLHDKLVLDHCVAKDMLPPKKLIGKREPVFVEKRRSALERYLSDIVSFLRETMPRSLALFLDFHKYDILFLLQELSSSFLSEGDLLLLKSKYYKFNPLQLHAISERLKQPCPPAEIFDRCYDFSHVLDFCCQLVTVEVEGSWNTVGSSDIVPNNCAFELSVLKDLEEIILNKVSTGSIYDAGTLRQTLKKLTIINCNLQSPVDFLLCDSIHKKCNEDLPEEKKWLTLQEVDFSNNQLTQFGSTILLVPNVRKLIANENHITQIDNFSELEFLTQLHLSANRISVTDNLHCFLKNVVHLDLSQNLISSLKGFSELANLKSLDLGSNLIAEVSEIQYIQSLKNLEYLVLTGNPVATVVDYRIKVLGYFGRRAASICLDNEKPSQKELDTVAVVLALQVVKLGKAPVFSKTIEPTFPNSPQ